MISIYAGVLLCALERFVGTAAVDRRHFRTHRPEVSHQLAAVMDVVIVGRPEKRYRWILHSEEINFLRELLAGRRAKALNSPWILARVERDNFIDRVEPCSSLALNFRIVDKHRVTDAIEKPEVRGGDVGHQIPRRPRLLIRLVVASIVGNRSQHLQSICAFAVEHFGEVIGDGFGVIRSHRHLVRVLYGVFRSSSRNIAGEQVSENAQGLLTAGNGFRRMAP